MTCVLPPPGPSVTQLAPEMVRSLLLLLASSTVVPVPSLIFQSAFVLLSVVNDLAGVNADVYLATSDTRTTFTIPALYRVDAMILCIPPLT